MNTSSNARVSYFLAVTLASLEKRHFERFGKVEAVTVASRNGGLVKLLCQRKVILRKLNMMGWQNPEDGARCLCSLNIFHLRIDE